MSRYLIVVDGDRCEANAICLQAAPEIFDIGDDDIAHALVDGIDADTEADVLAAALDAASQCPVGAIAVVPAASA